MKKFNLMESILNDYAMQGYKNMCKAEAIAHIKLLYNFKHSLLG